MEEEFKALKEKILRLTNCIEYADETINFWQRFLDKEVAHCFLDEVFQHEIKNSGPDEAYIPRRMINSVLRLVTIAEVLEETKQGYDAIKVFLFVTCIENLWRLNKQKPEKKVLKFFCENINSNDKKYLEEHIEVTSYDDDLYSCKQYDTITKLAEVFYEIRNLAAHEGNYYGSYFCKDTPYIFTVEIKQSTMCINTELTLTQFSEIFVRACFNFIQKYINDCSI